jgi:RNA polymerase sigma factor (sigma-70 family)
VSDAEKLKRQGVDLTVEAVKAVREKPRLGPGDDAARKRAAVETYARNEATLRRTARRYSLCADDADDAVQRGLEILLRKAPTEDPRELIKWMQTVVKHEALAIRRDRERILSGPAALTPDPDEEDWVALLPAGADGPAENAERREAVSRSREALQALKPQELRALTLLAEGYTYAEIGEITGYSQTKINRCLAEGRQRFRSLIARSADGRRCEDMQPLLSAFCDGEATPAEVAQVREHLRACAPCRATLRTYRAVPGAAAALAPLLLLDRSLWERVGDAVGNLFNRFGAGAGEPAAQVAGGAGGAGVAATVKIAALCVGAAGGAAACVATGVVPAPLDFAGRDQPPPSVERRLADLPAPAASEPEVEYVPAPAEPDSNSNPKPKHRDRERADRDPAPPAAAEPAPEPAATTAGEPVEYTPPPEYSPPPEPAPEPAPVVSSGGGSPAGEFGP